MSIIRTRCAAIGAAVAVTLGAGGIGIVSATQPADAVTFVPITPCRVMDTRTEFNVGPKTSPVGPGETYTVNTTTGNTGNCTNIPTTATGVSLNITALDATLPTFLTVWATGDPQPEASSLNPVPGQPPTPNAVTTGINTGGQFDIYNLQGNVQVIADINGYYTDHHHDDRYYTKNQTDSAITSAVAGKADSAGVYTKTQTDNRIADAVAGQPWEIYIGPNDMLPGTSPQPTTNFASGVNAIGMQFNDGVIGRVFYSFKLPANYVAGTDVAVDMRYLAISGFGAPVFPCDSVWWTNAPFVNRPDAEITYITTTWEVPRGFDATQTRLTSTLSQYNANVLSNTTMTIEGSTLLPGDEINLTLNRDGDETDDTCEGMMVTGLLVYPAG